MDGDISSRVEALRREIAEIGRLSREYLRNPTLSAKSDHEKRVQRLKEIMDELASMARAGSRREASAEREGSG
jgi:hypothetical protein